MSTRVEVITEPVEQTYKAELTLSNESIVDLLVLNYIQEVKAQRGVLMTQIYELNREIDNLVRGLWLDLSRVAYESVREDIEAYLRCLSKLSGRTIRSFPNYTDSPSSYREDSQCFYNLYEFLGIETLAYHSEEKSYDPNDWNKKIFRILPSLLEFGNDYYRITFFTITPQNLIPSESSCWSGTAIITSEHRERIIEIRSLYYEGVKLYREVKKLDEKLSDEEFLRLKISCALTKKLLSDAGLSLDIGKVWASMSTSIEEGMALAGLNNKDQDEEDW